jgi:peroxiredoxin Q/BCP
MSDIRGQPIDHDFVERVTFVVGKDHKIFTLLSSKDDHLAPDEHVKKSLEVVQKLAAQ